jgi:hypothetical protein
MTTATNNKAISLPQEIVTFNVRHVTFEELVALAEASFSPNSSNSASSNVTRLGSS